VRGTILLGILVSLARHAGAQPTYAHDVAAILQQKCQSCHRPNDIAPFSLLTYDDAVAQARAIRAAVGSGIMPPWKPIPGHGVFKYNLSLSDTQRQTLLDWIDAGTPMGDPADMPPPPPVSGSEWRLGTPDQILTMPVPYVPVPRDDRPDRYRCFILPNVTDQDRWVRAVDIVPGQRQVVHHVLLYLTDDPAQIALAQKFEAEDADPGYDCWGGPRITPGAGPGLLKIVGGLLGGWVPGAAPPNLPPTIGALIPKGAYLIMQVHYHLQDVVAPGADQTRIGLYFQPDTLKNRLLTVPILNDQFVLPPGAVGQEVDANFALDLGVPLPDAMIPKFSAVVIAPHMHELGHQIQADLTQPDGTHVPLIEIDDWDFHWQGLYSYVDPVPLPYHSNITAACVFDNTTDHEVRWGESTNDEMCLVYVGFIAEGGISSLLFGNPQ
jgi:cytochrome c551/c552